MVPQLRTCGSPMPAGGVGITGCSAASAACLEDPAVGGTTADPPAVVRPDDAVEAAHGLEVHQEGRLRQPELDQRQEAVAPGEDLRLALAVAEDPQGLVQDGRTDVFERCRDHRSAILHQPQGLPEALSRHTPTGTKWIGDGPTNGTRRDSIGGPGRLPASIGPRTSTRRTNSVSGHPADDADVEGRRVADTDRAVGRRHDQGIHRRNEACVRRAPGLRPELPPKERQELVAIGPSPTFAFHAPHRGFDAASLAAAPRTREVRAARPSPRRARPARTARRWMPGWPASGRPRRAGEPRPRALRGTAGSARCRS